MEAGAYRISLLSVLKEYLPVHPVAFNELRASRLAFFRWQGPPSQPYKTRRHRERVVSLNDC